jgi:hypothetical protein
LKGDTCDFKHVNTEPAAPPPQSQKPQVPKLEATESRKDRDRRRESRENNQVKRESREDEKRRAEKERRERDRELANRRRIERVEKEVNTMVTNTSRAMAVKDKEKERDSWLALYMKENNLVKHNPDSQAEFDSRVRVFLASEEKRSGNVREIVEQ